MWLSKDWSNLPVDVQEVLAVTGHEYASEWRVLNTKYNNSMALAVDAKTPDVTVVAESGSHDELMRKGGKYELLRNAYDDK
jgi:hypothetical protein